MDAVLEEEDAYEENIRVCVRIRPLNESERQVCMVYSVFSCCFLLLFVSPQPQRLGCLLPASHLASVDVNVTTVSYLTCISWSPACNGSTLTKTSLLNQGQSPVLIPLVCVYIAMRKCKLILRCCRLCHRTGCKQRMHV